MDVTTRVPLVVIGGGEHACVVADAVRTRGDAFDLIGYLDSVVNPAAGQRMGTPHLGDDSWLAAHPEVHVVLGVGGTRGSDGRVAAVAALGIGAERWATVVHRSAIVSPTASIAAGAVVMAGAIVNPHARVGAHALVNTGAIIEHDVVLHEHVMVGPGAAIGGGAVIGEGTYVGLGARIRDHVTIGRGVLVAMGAVVIGDVGDHVMIAGVPARVRERTR